MTPKRQRSGRKKNKPSGLRHSDFKGLQALQMARRPGQLQYLYGKNKTVEEVRTYHKDSGKHTKQEREAFYAQR